MVTASMDDVPSMDGTNIWMIFCQCLVSQAFGKMSFPLVGLAQTVK